jgi:hypothetical protein
MDTEMLDLDDGRSLSDLSISFPQTMNMLSGAEEIDDGGLGIFSCPVLSSPTSGSRTGSVAAADAGRSFFIDSLSGESSQVQAVRPCADDANRQAVRALKRTFQESESGRTISQEWMDVLQNFDDTGDAEVMYGDPNAIEIPSAEELLGIPDAANTLESLDSQNVQGGSSNSSVVFPAITTIYEDAINHDEVLNEVKVVTRMDAGRQIRVLLKPTSYQAKIIVERCYQAIKTVEENYIADATNLDAYMLSDCRTSSERPFPKPTTFAATRISTATGRILASLNPTSSTIDIRKLKERCTAGRYLARVHVPAPSRLLSPLHCLQSRLCTSLLNATFLLLSAGLIPPCIMLPLDAFSFRARHPAT